MLPLPRLNFLMCPVCSSSVRIRLSFESENPSISRISFWVDRPSDRVSASKTLFASSSSSKHTCVLGCGIVSRIVSSGFRFGVSDDATDGGIVDTGGWMGSNDFGVRVFGFEYILYANTKTTKRANATNAMTSIGRPGLAKTRSIC